MTAIFNADTSCSYNYRASPLSHKCRRVLRSICFLQTHPEETRRQRYSPEDSRQRRPQVLLVSSSSAIFAQCVMLTHDFNSGSDSAPHLIQTKTTAEQGKAPAGVFTQPAATQLVLLALEEGIERGVISESDVTQEKLEGFLSRFGRRFYKLPETSGSKIILERKGEKIPASVRTDDGKFEVGISRAGTEAFSLSWQKA